MSSDKTKADWDEEWYRKTLHYLLIDAIRAEAKEQLIKESLQDTGYEEYKRKYFQFLQEHTAATSELKKTSDTPPGDSP